MQLVEFNGEKYPQFQAEGNAAQFAIPFAKHFCKGIGYDIGCNKVDWSLPGSIPIDPVINKDYEANNLPNNNVDYIFSSHCLEHLDNWVETIEYWYDCLKLNGGILFLYLPHYSQSYWRPWNNKKHKQILDPFAVKDCMIHFGFKNIFLSGIDLNNSYMIVGEK